jgi:nucleotide-binding universal stress UspA family protein
MSKTIVIAYDGSSFADAAIDDLKRAGLGEDVKALLVVVPDRWMLELPTTDSEADAATRGSVAEAEGFARQGYDRLKENFPTWNVEAFVHPLSPAEAVLAVAEHRGAELVVVGSRGRNAVGRLLLGSVSQTLLHNAPCSVRIGRAHSGGGAAPLRLVVGMDGGSDAQRALEEIGNRAWPSGTAIRLVAVVGAPIFPYAPNVGFDMTGWPEGIPIEVRSKMEEFADAAAKKLIEKGLLAEAVVREGGVAPTLLEDAHEWGADAIFIGARGHRLVERILLGSVSSTVAARANCTVEVVRGEGIGSGE